MPATPKSQKQAPPRRFENYILTRAVPSEGQTGVPETAFSPLTMSGSLDPSAGGTDDGLSQALPIGFDFSFDGIVYKQWVGCTNGWLALVDPARTQAFVADEVISGSIWMNSSIKQTFTSNAVLIAPWFENLKNVSATPNQLYNSGSINATKRDRLVFGFEPPVSNANEARFGVKYYTDTRSSSGRRLIVRWHSIVSASLSQVNFESVIYENGTIEFRYPPKNTLYVSSSTFEGATVGVFMPGGTNRFRDFSLGLGYRDNERGQYIYGGATFTGSFTDTSENFTAAYANKLTVANNWPAPDYSSAKFVFQPPVNRTRVLPRFDIRVQDSQLTLPTTARTGDQRGGSAPVSFDDRRTFIFTGSFITGSRSPSSSVVVNYPSTLPRFYGGTEPSVSTRQGLFASDFELTGSIVKSALDQLPLGLNISHPKSVQPFTENKLFENSSAAATDQFFLTGTSINDVGLGLSQPLKAKTHVKLSMAVDHSISMLGVSSSIYYFNTRLGAWEIPQNASYVVASASNSVPTGNTKGDLAPASIDSSFQRIIEDSRGFGPIGNALVSGSNFGTGGIASGLQTDFAIGSQFTKQNVTDALSKRYAKSVSNNPDYQAVTDELFSLPINQPFLIEKAVIEIPVTMGDGWFKDRTTCFTPYESSAGSFDFAGPALTVALYSQHTIGSTTRRDLIMTGTITHVMDNMKEIVFASSPSFDTTFYIRQRGFQAFGGAPSAVVTPVSASSTGYTFSGSVAVPCTAQATNGVIAWLERTMTGGTTSINRSGVLDTFNASTISMKNSSLTNFTQSVKIGYIDNFGRASTGFDPSGRSVFGKEFGVAQNLLGRSRVQNPFYLTQSAGAATFNNLSNSGMPAQFVQAILTGSNFKVETVVPLRKSLASPYLVFPQDKLILAISKTRPFMYGTTTTDPFTSGSVRHDVTLVTGSVNITLYGSLLQEGQEYHDTLNQPLASNAIHELIASEPVLDQFEVSYRETYISGTYDDYVAGTMITRIRGVDGRPALMTGSRGKLFGRGDPRNAPTPGLSAFDLNNSLSFQLEPYSERAGSLRVSQHTSNVERFWDSLMPAINQCFAANGAGIFLLNGNDLSILNTDSLIVDPRVTSTGSGFIWFDYGLSSLFPEAAPLNDSNWTWSYPFEPRYSAIARQQNIQKSFIANYWGRGGGPGTSTLQGSGTLINPVPVAGFYFGPVGTETLGNPVVVPAGTVRTLDHNYCFVADAKIGTKTSFNNTLTGSAGLEDTVKALFGFGDINNMMTSSAGAPMMPGLRFGTNHFAEFRTYRITPDGLSGGWGWGTHFGIGPIIRGWKYGVYSGLPTFSKAYYRQSRYGQFRDMLEQRLTTKFYSTKEKGNVIEDNLIEGAGPSAVTVKFVNVSGSIVSPLLTGAQNLSFEATSSMPYLDGTARNR